MKIIKEIEGNCRGSYSLFYGLGEDGKLYCRGEFLVCVYDAHNTKEWFPYEHMAGFYVHFSEMIRIVKEFGPLLIFT